MIIVALGGRAFGVETFVIRLVYTTPLGFQKFFIKNIQKAKNGLRIICYAPHQSVSRTASPRGEAYEIG